MPGRFLEIPVFLGDYFLCRTLYMKPVMMQSDDGDDDDNKRTIYKAP